MNKKNKKQAKRSTNMAALADGNMGATMQSALYDPNGSWTGNPYMGMVAPEMFEPEQDADDL